MGISFLSGVVFFCGFTISQDFPFVNNDYHYCLNIF